MCHEKFYQGQKYAKNANFAYLMRIRNFYNSIRYFPVKKIPGAF